MTRHEAYIEKDWQTTGLAHLLVTRIRADGSADYAVFLVDLFCLGVKDTFGETDIPEARVREFVADKLPEDYRVPIHFTCAKKLIEGAIAYAEKLGFTPHRDFRKTRKVLNGIDASACPRDFVFGCDDRPRYVRGSDDSDERADRICAVLAARCGADGFDYEDPGAVPDAGHEALELREALMDWLDREEESVPRFYELSGLMTAMLICPTVVSPVKIMEVLWGPEGRTWETQAELTEFTNLLMPYWNQLSSLVENALTSQAKPSEQIFDIWEEDFDEENGGIAMAAATMEWAKGFRRATELWPEAWGNALTRTDLAPHWEVVGWWNGFDQKENRDSIVTHAEAKPPRTLNESGLALARALRIGR